MVAWVFVTQIMVQYLGTFVFISNIFGSMMKIIIFSTQRSYRTKPCTFFMLASAVAGCIQLFATIVSRILATGFNIDLTRTILSLCRLRQFAYGAAPGISIMFDWLSTVDQYLVTSRHARLRQLSTMKLAYRVTTGVLVFWFLHCTPFLVLNNIQSSVCVIDNLVLKLYFLYVHLWCLNTFVPIIMVTIFGVLAYRNMHTLTSLRQLSRADRQLTIMVCAQVLVILLTVIPFGSYYIYSSATSSQQKSKEQLDIEAFVLNLFSLIGGCRCGTNFYVFLVVSSRFRQHVKQYLCCCLMRENAVQPITNQTFRLKTDVNQATN